MSDKTKETPKVSKKKSNKGTGIPVNGVWGIVLFIVCISAGYNVFLVLTGTDGLTNQIMAAPTVLAILSFLLLKAWK